LSIEQLLAFRHEQLRAMPPALLDIVRDSICSGSGSDCRRHNDSTEYPHHPGVSDAPPNRNDEPTTNAREVVTEDSGSLPAAATENPRIVVMVTDGDILVVTISDEENTTDSNSSNDLQQTRPPSNDDDSNRDIPVIDPFQDPSLIDDLVDSIPDRITSQNVEQFAAFLSVIPAAQIASRLVPEAVS